MSSIADTNGGAFTYVEHTAAVNSAFAACLGRALASSVAGVTVVLTAVGGARVVDVTTGYAKTVDDARRRVVVDFGVLQEGEERDVLVEVTLPAGSDGAAVEALHACAYIGGIPVGQTVAARLEPGPGPAAGAPSVVAAAAAAAPVGESDVPRSDGLTRSIVLARADKPPVMVPDKTVECSVVRVTGAKVLEAAAAASATGDIGRTQTLLKAFIDDATSRG